jgi:hypothetical protein
MSGIRDQRTPDHSHVLPSKTRMLPTIGRSQSPDAKTYSQCQRTKNRKPGIGDQESDPTRDLQTRFCRPVWWSRSESNRRPPACKAGALPTELRPRIRGRKTEDRRQNSTIPLCPLTSVFCPLTLVGLGRFELPTSRLSGVRSNQLSYRPLPEDRGQKTDDRAETVGASNQRSKARHSLCPLSSVP